MSTTSARPVSPKLRAATRHIGGNALGRVLRLQRATSDYTVKRVEVPMRDGIRLVADHYEPTSPNPAGTLLVR